MEESIFEISSLALKDGLKSLRCILTGINRKACMSIQMIYGAVRKI